MRNPGYSLLKKETLVTPVPALYKEQEIIEVSNVMENVPSMLVNDTTARSLGHVELPSIGHLTFCLLSFLFNFSSWERGRGELNSISLNIVDERHHLADNRYSVII